MNDCDKSPATISPAGAGIGGSVISKTRFLEGSEIKGAVEEILEAATRVDLAVAYWGHPSLRPLTRKSWTTPTRIICDLMSGSCDVDTIEALLAKPGVDIKMLPRLHSKIYWSPAAAIVGSANASSRGLDAKATSNVEAALRTSQQDVLDDIESWFETQWNIADDIESRHLAAARMEWNKPKQPMAPLGKLTKAQNFLKNILTAAARRKILNWGRATRGVVAVRFGITGKKGTKTNFQAIYGSGPPESFRLPADDGIAHRSGKQWEPKRLTRAFPVRNVDEGWDGAVASSPEDEIGPGDP